MKVLALLFLVFGLALATRNFHLYSIEKAELYFENFIKIYNRHYVNREEKVARLEIFKHNLKLINQKNLKSNITIYGINKFSDLTSEEFIRRHTGLKIDLHREASQCKMGTDDATSGPDSFSWKDQGVISKPKDQGFCGSCWAFSAIGNVEAYYAIKNKEILDLSEQQLVDCDKRSSGCSGTNDTQNPFLYLMDSGAMQEKDYRYEEKDGKCKFDASKVKVKVADCITHHPDSEDVLKNIIHSNGPISIAVDATAMQTYTGHVLDDCPGDTLNHMVLIVGYGTENDVPYWLIKNSWGESYGEDGYIKIKRGVNACGMMNDAGVQAVVD